ncbi:hypothetical protein [Vitiosangium sp. GDMCC 1.1324]|uniref:hypothetical protein n=1 Tax=Vitiosangium sp. (strain GDMCC 1.1324) TaxID=2138576 RepID=UPI000D363711|nr:hypothetical protein [Vitiosangium sp. GDMCC 1.1324]PTL83596.1 hypothetical protein DAT35_08895 [Vitiosangium sp. GDMCC 1.1324]
MQIKVAVVLLGLSLAAGCNSSHREASALIPDCPAGQQLFFVFAVNDAVNCTAINNVCAVDQAAAVTVGRKITPTDRVFACPASSVSPVGLCELSKPVVAIPSACQSK